MSAYHLLALFFVLATISWMLTGQVRRYALVKLLDVPNARSSHQLPTPRGGGLALVVTIFGALAAFLGLHWLPQSLVFALLAGVPLATIGFVDDHGDVSAKWRFLIQLLVSVWVLWFLGENGTLTVSGLVIPLGWWAVPFGVLFMTWFINLFNFMDGIDGIEGVEVVSVALSAVTLLLIGGGGDAEILVLIVISGATMGFLVWNWPPAKIFMGDVGSGVLGFLIAVMAIDTALSGRLSLCAWLILTAVFFVDATMTLVVRMMRGERWYQAHRSHAYQQASRRFGGHRAVTLAVFAINVFWLLPLAVLAQLRPDIELLSLAISWVPLVVFANWLGAGRVG